ncbi:hypothetical protein LWI29_014579 [Acer saccharum]|uniref:Protein DCL, chloroplastic n=1 Tax=Acer saccharum TaxID=4024 RepID=A0AA39RM74_ACESA|nr:hypothetical protein LWI29_014579 [Acer saccharum]
MASITKPPPFVHRHSNPTSLCSSPVILSFPFYRTTSLRLRVSALKSNGDKIGSQESYGSNLLRKPIISSTSRDLSGNLDKEESSEEEEEEDDEEEEEEEEEAWIDWEDKILEETVPLVGFVRMLLHSGRYESGARLDPEHETTILERLLPYHPEFEKKIGCGIDYITIGYHPEFEGSRCLFVVRKDGELIDFSYWKCIKGLIRKNYPLYADSFILRHFRRHRSG